MRERGAVLLLFLVLLVGGMAALLWRLEGAAAGEARARRAASMAALAEAREALIGYALRDANRPGELPCPDFNRDGVIRIVGAARDYSGSRCRSELGGAVQAGWLPWRTLGLPPLRDGYGEPLWYVVANDYHANAAALLNSDTPGALTVAKADEVTGDHVALLIASGPPLAGQAPRPASAFDALLQRERYLEGESGDGDLRYAADGNDLLLPLSRKRLMELLERRVAGAAARLLADYHAACGVYPFAARLPATPGAAAVSADTLREGVLPLDGARPHPWGGACGDQSAPRPAAWMSAWQPMIHYAFAAPSCSDELDDCLRLLTESGVRDGIEALVIIAGGDLTAARPSADPADYLEGENARGGDGLFERRQGDPAFNDRVRVVAPR